MGKLSKEVLFAEGFREKGEKRIIAAGALPNSGHTNIRANAVARQEFASAR